MRTSRLYVLVAAFVWNAPQAADAQARQDWQLREVWRFGAVDPLPGQELAGPFIAVAVSPQGTVAVLDQALATVTLLDGRDGRFLGRVGRPGRGPGELGGPVAIDWDDVSRLWIEDQLNRRYNIYGADGTWLGDVARPSVSANRRVFPMRVLAGGSVLDHDVAAGDLRVFTVDSTGLLNERLRVAQPPRPEISGIVRAGSALQEVVSLRPSLLWTFSQDEATIWLGRTDSVSVLKVGLTGDTIARGRTTHRSAEFTSEQRDAVRQANRELGRDGGFVPILVQALHGLSDGRVLAQVGSDRDDPGVEFDLFGRDGAWLGTLRADEPPSHRSVLDAQGDTLFAHVLGPFDTPMIVKAVLEAR